MMDKKKIEIIPIPGRPDEGIGEDGLKYQIGEEDGKKLFKKLTKKKSVGLDNKRKGQWEKANRRYCAIGEMFEAKKRTSRETNRAIAGYIFVDLEQNPNKYLGEKKNPYLSAKGVYDIIKRRKWEKPYREK